MRKFIPLLICTFLLAPGLFSASTVDVKVEFSGKSDLVRIGFRLGAVSGGHRKGQLLDGSGELVAVVRILEVNPDHLTAELTHRAQGKDPGTAVSLHRKLLTACMLLATIPFLLYPSTAETILVYPITVLAGFLTGIPHPILVVAAQRMLPGRVGTASGIILGLTFASGSLGTLVSGLQADRWGFDPVFISTAGIAAVTALLVWAVPKSSLGLTKR